ncbi:MAG: TnsA endonuclease N-terminal domain-containing protein [Chloroflexota bacterium]
MSRWVGKFPSLKLGRMVGYQSLIEQDFIYLLDFVPTVSDYCEQPFSIHYKEGGKERQYTPDFSFVQCGQRYLIECKHHHYMRPQENQLKWEAAHRWACAHGVVFSVVTEQMIRAGYGLENVKLLTDYARYEIDPATQTAVLHILAEAASPMSVASLLTRLSPDKPQAAITTVLHLAYHHFLHIPLTPAPITVDSSVTLNPAAGEGQLLPAALFA